MSNAHESHDPMIMISENWWSREYDLRKIVIFNSWIMKSRDPLIMIWEGPWSAHILIFSYGP